MDLGSLIPESITVVFSDVWSAHQPSKFSQENDWHLVCWVSNSLRIILSIRRRILNLTSVIRRTFRSSRRIGIEIVRRRLATSSRMIHATTSRKPDTASTLETQRGANYSEISADSTYHQQSSAVMETRPQVWLITGYIHICYFAIHRS